MQQWSLHDFWTYGEPVQPVQLGSSRTARSPYFDCRLFAGGCSTANPSQIIDGRIIDGRIIDGQIIDSRGRNYLRLEEIRRPQSDPFRSTFVQEIANLGEFAGDLRDPGLFCTTASQSRSGPRTAKNTQRTRKEHAKNNGRCARKKVQLELQAARCGKSVT
ncbi:MAG: hypothetical protein ACI9HK_004862 [Pirellulaceae bacterium]